MVCPGGKGEQLNDEPRFHMLSQLRYTRPIINTDWEFFGQLTAEYYDEPYQVVNTPNIEDILTFDVMLGVQETGGAWSAKVWSKNITDETVILSETVEDEAITGALLGYSAFPRAPRSFGVTIDYRF